MPMMPPEGMGPPPKQDIYVNYISGLLMDEQGIDAQRSAVTALRGSKLTADEVQGGILSIKGSSTNVLYNEDGTRKTPTDTHDETGKRIWQWICDKQVGIYNGITVLGGKKRISDLQVRYAGNGGDDFHMYGTAVAVANEAQVVMNRCQIETRGVIATAIAAAGNADVLVENSHVVSRGTSNEKWYKYNEKGMTSAAWVLGGRGTVRTTNALGAATMSFYNTYGEANGWGVYSGDEAADIHQNIVNSTAKIASAGEPDFHAGDFGAGYGVYALSNTHSNVLGSFFDIPDYAMIIAGGWTTHNVGSSSQKNLMELIGKDSLLYQETEGFRDIPEQNTVIDSDNFGFLWHSNCSGTLNILSGTELHVGDTVFQIKGGEILSNSPKIFVTDAIIDNGGRSTPLTIVHLMESDDAGQTDEISLHHDYKWAICHMSTARRGKISDTPTAKPEFHFKNMKLTGNFYNSVDSAVQCLELDFDHCTVDGEISSAHSEHIYKSYYYGMRQGEQICIDEAGRAYKTLREAPYTSRSMGGNSVTRVYVHPEVDEQGEFRYDEGDTNRYDSVGYAIYYRDAQYIGKVRAMPEKTVNNPVTVRLRGDSSWRVRGCCHLSRLELEQGSCITGRLFKNGEEIPTVPGSYQGDLLLLEEETV